MMRTINNRLVIAPSHEVRELAHVIARALNDGRLARMSIARRERLREIALEIAVLADDQQDEEEAPRCPDPHLALRHRLTAEMLVSTP